MSFDPDQPYNDLPDLPPFGDVETKAVLKACIVARIALAELDAAAAKLPNPEILISTLMLFEAQSSSEIENIVTTDDALFKHSQLDEATIDVPTKEALRYRDALFRGYLKLERLPISTRLAVETCSTLKGTDMEIRKLPGTALKAGRSGKLIYTPPVGEELLRAKLANWERFINEPSDLDPLVQLAIQHYQFEAIHPFHDGNGRTGRILNILFLVQKYLLKHPILYLSREILENRDRYYSLLRGVTEHGAWVPWIEFFVMAVELSATRSMNKVLKISLLRGATKIYLAQCSEFRLAEDDVLDVLFTQPYCRIKDLVDAGVAKRQTAAVYLKTLAGLGVVEELKIGREKLFLHKKFLSLLTTDGSSVTNYAVNALAPSEFLFPITAQNA